MDKNMINIDDLFKQRLTGAEEKERPGAWLQMRELLDKEMPVAAPGSTTNWRRMFGYAAGLVLLASATIGGYQAYTSFRSEPSKDIVAVNYNNLETVNNADGNANQPKENSTSSIASANGNENTPGHGASNTENNDATGGRSVNTAKTVTNSNNATEKPSVTAKSSKTVTNSNNSGENLPISGKPAKTVTTERSELVNSSGKTSGSVTNNNNGAVASNDPSTANTQKNQQKSTTFDNRSKSKIDDNSLNSNKINNPAASNATAKPGAAPERNFAAGNNAANTGASKGSAPNKPSGNNTAAGNKAAQPTKPAEVAKSDYTAKQMIDKIETKETYDRKSGTWKQDTIDQGKVEWSAKEESLVAMKGGEARTKNNVEMLPSANVEANGKALNEAEELLPLSNFRTASKNTNYTTSNFLEEMVKNAKMQLGGVKFYPGVLLGVNTALSGKNSMSGFQLGVTGALSLNDKWAIVSELKYMHRFKGQGESNRNDYIQNTQSVQQGNNTVYVSDSMKHYFTYPSISTFELPIMLRYSVQRFNVLVGGNMAYNVGFSPNEVTQKYTVTSSTRPEKPADGAILTPGDFKSRFGVGYQIGAGYQFSPAIGIDARLSQSIWNSGSGAGVERVSRDVYQTPTLLINFNYRFSSNKYKPYRQQ